MSHKRVVLRILLIVFAVALSGTIIAQVSNQINLADVWSPTGLKPKPNDLRVPPNRTASTIFTNPADIPDEVAYGQVFQQIEALNGKADFEQQNNRDGMKFRNVYKEKARLDERQARDLDRIAKQTNQRIKQLDNQAKQIIQRIRAKTPGGRLPQGQVPPMTPPELEQLTLQKKNLILQGVGELRQNFGEAEFARFADFVNQKVKPGIKKVKTNKKD
jgi:predicted transglutaminase-like cysteine proteinase